MQSISERSLHLEKFGLKVSLAPDQKLTDQLSFDLKLKVTPASKITPEARAYISYHKAAIMGRLMGDEAVHDCMSCPHWQGVLMSTDWQGRSTTRGGCAAGVRPWRISNIISQPDFHRWHFVGKCSGPFEGSI